MPLTSIEKQSIEDRAQVLAADITAAKEALKRGVKMESGMWFPQEAFDRLVSGVHGAAVNVMLLKRDLDT